MPGSILVHDTNYPDYEVFYSFLQPLQMTAGIVYGHFLPIALKSPDVIILS
jgi:hypothetical protein